jgi:hypothetical protein
MNDYSTRRKRRTALSCIVSTLGQISLAEETYMNNTPINLQNSEAYETTEYYIDLLEEAIDLLRSVYDG